MSFFWSQNWTRSHMSLLNCSVGPSIIQCTEQLQLEDLQIASTNS